MVTGGAGFIGSHLVDRLMQEGFSLRTLDNFSAGKAENIQRHLHNRSFHLVKGDIRNLRDVEKAIKDVDVVFHLAAIVNVPLSVEDPLLVNDVNVRGTLNLLMASAKRDIQRFIYASTCAVYGDAHHLPINEEHPIMPLSPYGISKYTAELYCKIFHRIHSLETVCLRFFNVYGPRQVEGPYSGVITQFISRLRQGKPPIIYGDGEQTRDFVHVEDVVEAGLLALGCQHCAGEVINIGTRKPTTINELARVLGRMFGETAISPEHAPVRAGDLQDSFADIGKAEKILGYKSRIGLKDGIERLVRDLGLTVK